MAPGGSWQTDPTLHERPEVANFVTIAAKTAPLARLAPVPGARAVMARHERSPYRRPLV